MGTPNIAQDRHGTGPRNSILPTSPSNDPPPGSSRRMWMDNFKRKTQNKHGSTLEPSYGNGRRPNHQKGFSVGPITMW